MRRKNNSLSLPPTQILFSSISERSQQHWVPERREMAIAIAPFLSLRSISRPSPRHSRGLVPNTHRITCVKLDADADTAATSIMCEACNGKGWLLCDFCDGQKTNVKAQNKRIYRRCPSCRAVGYVLCSRCKVFKCVTFPDFSDSQIN